MCHEFKFRITGRTKNIEVKAMDKKQKELLEKREQELLEKILRSIEKIIEIEKKY